MQFVRPQYQEILAPILQLMCACVCVCVRQREREREKERESVSGTANIEAAPQKILQLYTNTLWVTFSFQNTKFGYLFVVNKRR
jgi:hypothetical protein